MKPLYFIPVLAVAGPLVFFSCHRTPAPTPAQVIKQDHASFPKPKAVTPPPVAKHTPRPRPKPAPVKPQDRVKPEATTRQPLCPVANLPCPWRIH
jgi:outer membrane biosynthesis protein TonB